MGQRKGCNSEVGTTNGEGLGGPTRRILLNSDQDDGVDHQEDEAHQGNHATGLGHEHSQNMYVYEVEFNNQGEVTKDVHCFGSTERQIHSKCWLTHSVEDADNLETCHKPNTHSWAHHG